MIRTVVSSAGVCLRRLARRVEGQDLIEYAVLIALIAGTVLIAATELGVKVPGMYATTAEALPGQGAGSPGDGNPGNGGGQPGNPGRGGGSGK
jgi:Flp pilus assembly pilin Flp